MIDKSRGLSVFCEDMEWLLSEPVNSDWKGYLRQKLHIVKAVKNELELGNDSDRLEWMLLHSCSLNTHEGEVVVDYWDTPACQWRQKATGVAIKNGDDIRGKYREAIDRAMEAE